MLALIRRISDMRARELAERACVDLKWHFACALGVTEHSRFRRPIPYAGTRNRTCLTVTLNGLGRLCQHL